MPPALRRLAARASVIYSPSSSDTAPARRAARTLAAAKAAPSIPHIPPKTMPARKSLAGELCPVKFATVVMLSGTAAPAINPHAAKRRGDRELSERRRSTDATVVAKTRPIAAPPIVHRMSVLARNRVTWAGSAGGRAPKSDSGISPTKPATAKSAAQTALVPTIPRILRTNCIPRSEPCGRLTALVQLQASHKSGGAVATIQQIACQLQRSLASCAVKLEPAWPRMATQISVWPRDAHADPVRDCSAGSAARRPQHRQRHQPRHADDSRGGDSRIERRAAHEFR